MGTRGPLPALKTVAAKSLSDLTPPDWLGEEAQAHWSRHAGYLAKNLLLTDQTADSFAMLCDLWGRLRAMSDQPTTRAYLDTYKAYTSSAKVFRLVPCDKPGAAVLDRHEDKPEFSF